MAAMQKLRPVCLQTFYDLGIYLDVWEYVIRSDCS